MCILSGLNTLPAILNNRSTGAEEAGTDKYFVANFASIGNLIFIFFPIQKRIDIRCVTLFSNVSVNTPSRS